MQFFILFTGAMVFVFFTFEKPPMVFQHAALEVAKTEAQYAPVQRKFDDAYESRRQAAAKVLEARRSGDASQMVERAAEFKASDKALEAAHTEAVRLAGKAVGEPGLNDTNYIFLSFVTRYMPVGIVGLIMAAIFAAAMLTISAEINSLATVSVIDVYKRHMKKDASDRHYLAASRWATAFWGLYAVITAEFAQNLGSLVEAVNKLGSYFYGGLLGIFVLAFFFRRVGGTAAFIGVLAGEAAIFSTAHYTKVAFLWYNVIGCLVVIATALLLSFVWERKQTSVTL